MQILRIAAVTRIVLAGLALVTVLKGSEFAGFGQDTGNVAITVNVLAVNGQAAPLRILGFRLPEKVGESPRILVQNATTKTVRAFWVEVVGGKSDGSSEEEFPKDGESASFQSNASNLHKAAERVIPPGITAEVHETVLEGHRLALIARRVHSPCLRIVTVIRNVEFADGTTWLLGSDRQLWQIWKESLPLGAQPCHQPDAEAIVRKLEGSGQQSVGTPTRIDQGLKQSFSFACPIREIRGKLMAVCPF